ncbi:acetyltransferase [Azospirillum doebereinerae]|uniref:Acetyltransferase n=1 Tax=Azospirillum doebereinerae TaxID=92933 RepID=A0A433JCR9_9PROT|nr:acetyltransferase [Azospirillum doebereinerae]MCG5238435.1 acetyltransferase [Azospirillum doebereinerae]RUQ74524.1 acetyltransferase [Azospirillum doebereinerae]
MIGIRAARADDLARNAEIWRSAVLATHHFLTPRHFAEIGDLVRTTYLPTADLLVAVDERDVPHGFLGASGDHIDALFVHAGSRGGGFGRRLVDHLRQGRDDVTVDVNEQNESGRGFYERLGFAVHGRSETDDDGRPYPLLRLRWRRTAATP